MKKMNCKKYHLLYELSEAVIETRFAGIVLSPVRIEPRIEVLNIAKNCFRENGEAHYPDRSSQRRRALTSADS